jgi:hypothetical protein
VLRRGRLLAGALLSALIVVALTAGAQANHSSVQLLSQGTIAGTDPYVAFYPLGGSSVDGAHAFFETDEALLPTDTDNSFDVYQRFNGTTTRESFGSTGGNGDPNEVFFDATSNDGTHVFFDTDEQLESGDNDNQIDIYDRSGGTTTYVSDGAGSFGDAAYDVTFNAISTDGSKAFFTTAEKLVTGDTDNCSGDGCDDVYERSGGTTTLVSAGANGAFHATFGGGSADGSRIFFETDESLVGTDTDDCDSAPGVQGCIDVYERSGGTTTLVSTGSPGNGAYDATFEGTSTDGTKVFFTTAEPLVASDTDDCDPSAAVSGCTDVYERSGGSTSLISAGGNGAFNVAYNANSQDGSRVFFNSNESLAAGDSDSQSDVYERSGGTTTRLSTGSTGGNGAIPASFDGASADGSVVFFTTAEKLENPPDTDSVKDVYSRSGGTTKLISIGSSGGNGTDQAFFWDNSLDGTRVFFTTKEKLENPPDTDSSDDVYERSGSGLSVVSIGPNGGNGAFNVSFDGISPDGSHVFFHTSEKLQNPPDTDNSIDVYDAGVASGYARPKASTPVVLRLVPAFKQCTTATPAGMTHGAPLAVPSCSPAQESSNHLTIGGPEHTNTQAALSSSMIFKVLGESPIDTMNGDQADVQINLELRDIRNNTSPYTDYAGEVQGVIGLRITDSFNGPTLTGPATAADLTIPFTVACTPTGGSFGSDCNVSTTLDTLTANTVRENKRAVWQLSQVQVFDGGPDGDADTGPNTLFMTQGTFAP